MKLLIVGGLGFLGKHCLEQLSQHDVTIIGRSTLSEPLVSINHRYHQLDVTNTQLTQIFINSHQFSHLLYLSWPSTPPHNDVEHINFAHATLEFLKVFGLKNPSARVVMTGSIHETGFSQGLVPDDFEGAEPKNLYGISKRYVHDCATVLCAELLKDLSFCWARLSNVYGAGDHANKLISMMIANSIAGKDFELKNPNSCVDFVNVQDAVEGLIAVLLSEYKGCLNIGSGCGYFLSYLKEIIESTVHDKDISSLSIDVQQLVNNGVILDISTANKILQYSPKVTLKLGITECIKYLKKGKINEQRNTISST